jgi:HAD superfamily hydrolase (TIGR01509 family)
MQIHALVFDFDGLILDTETPEVLTWRDIYAEHGFEYPKEVWSRFAGIWPTPDDDAGAWLQRMSSTRLDLDALRARQRAASDALTLELPVMAGAHECLEAARRLGLRLAVASSSGHAWVDAHLQRLGLRERFQLVVCGDDVAPGRTKPHPDLYLKALHELELSAREAIAFEDSPIGVEAAHRAGMFVVAIPNPVTAHLPMPGADLVFKSLAEVALEAVLHKAAEVVKPESGKSALPGAQPAT